MATERRVRVSGPGVTGDATRAGTRGAVPWAPSWRSLLVGLGLIVTAAGLYLVARGTSIFAIERIEVRGVSAGAASRVRGALEPLAGSSLVAFDQADGDRRLARLPMVAEASYDRDFPHTLVVTVVAERPIALLRRGSDAWVVSETGRVLRRVTARPLPSLPRIWLPANADPLVGAAVADEPAVAIQALTAVADEALGIPIRSVRIGDGEAAMTLRSGTVIVLGAPSQLALKAAVAARVLELSPAARTIDVSVPERAVASETAPR